MQYLLYLFMLPSLRVSDPNSFNADPDPKNLNADPSHAPPELYTLWQNRQDFSDIFSNNEGSHPFKLILY
jgi:hypothetical protein